MAETAATYTVPEHHVVLFTANVQAALTKMGGLIAPLMTAGAYLGDKAQVVKFIGPVEFTERNTPYSDTKLTHAEHTQRWIVGAEYDCAILVDRLDLLKMLDDPTNPYVMRMQEAAARKRDQIAMSKFFATAKTGVQGATNTSFPAGNIVAHGSVGLTFAKLRSLRKLIKKKHVDLRLVSPYIAVTADEVDDLLGETQVGSNDYNAVKTLVDGEVSKFMGFTMIPYEDLGDGTEGQSIPSVAGGAGLIRDLPVWVPDGMHFGDWAGLTITINNRADKNNIPQIHATFTAGATRLEENKVFAAQTDRAV
ncbi:MAG: hypothetical protein KAR40_15320 [Candidatus Sabulitectum sp.]|nr:hypothetical protein [Candidatus Sabulitectum sp.]